MDTSWTQELLGWLNANPGWGFSIVFLVAFFESLVLIGILLPGIVILFGVGTLVGLGLVDMLPIWIAASAGAFLGDFLSYLLGRHCITLSSPHHNALDILLPYREKLHRI